MLRRILPILLALALVGVACGGGDDGGADATTSTGPIADDTTTSAGSTTTDPASVGPPTTRGPAPDLVVEPLGSLGGITVLSGEPAYRGVLGQVDPDRNIVPAVALPPDAAGPGIAPLTGLALDAAAAAEIAERPALVAKIDNTDRGRPQEALAQADIVFEEMIEGGFTRLAAVYHSHAPTLGPVRSGRTTDIAILGSFNSPVFVWSGANLVHAALLRRQNLIDLGAQSRSEYFRAADRPGTYDLMTEAETMFEIAAGRDAVAPMPQFEYRNDEVGLPTTAEAATDVRIDYPSVTVEWSWDAAADGWARTQNGTDHVDAQEQRVVAANVVVAEVDDVATGSVDTAGSTVFEQQFLGSGRGWVFTDGHVVEVTWTKPSIHSVATWTTDDGVPVALTPGTTWVELVREGTTTIG